MPAGYHAVDLWHHEELSLVVAHDSVTIPVTAEGFSRAWLGTRDEGSVDCIALLPQLLSASLEQDSLTVKASRGTRIVVWAGTPAYGTRSVELSSGTHALSLIDRLGRHEEKVVVQLFDSTELLDERVVNIPLATPRLISRTTRTSPAAAIPAGMVRIPAGTFTYETTRSFLSPNEAIPYPGSTTPKTYQFPALYMDTYPVTNAQFKEFMVAAKYAPADPTNFLKHWNGGSPPAGDGGPSGCVCGPE